MKKFLRRAALLAGVVFGTASFWGGAAEAAGFGDKIIYVPIDDRPVNCEQVIEVTEKIGVDVLLPPAELLGRYNDYGHAEELWAWLRANAPKAKAAVVSSDAMLYGSLVGSRMHELSEGEIMARAEKFKSFHDDFPSLRLYVFGTIMRTPRSGAFSSAEPEYYKQYGAKIFDYTALKDKEETGEISRREKKELRRLGEEIPTEVLDNWFGRRKKNYAANEYLTELTREGEFAYFLLGCDDSAIYSQTHLESRHLSEAGRDLGETKTVVTSGADELGMLMVARAVNDIKRDIPFLFVKYNVGTGADTVPSYVNEKIGDSIDAAIRIVGGMKIFAPERADFVVAVSTNYDGKTLEAENPANVTKPRKGTAPFVAMVKDFAAKNIPVGVADIAFSNGADNALMAMLAKENLLFRLHGYGGWNTATNSTGFLIGEGVLTKRMSERDIYSLLVTRYLDDWAYQANVRAPLRNGGADYSDARTSERATEMIADFAAKNIILPRGFELENIAVTFPWHRAFECGVTHEIAQKN